MNAFEDIKLYLPKYLSQEAERDLFEELNQFPKNIDHRLYTVSFVNDENIYQGDGFKDLLFIELPEPEISKSKGMVLSNTCDMQQANKKPVPLKVCYSPIISLKKYKSFITKNKLISNKSAINIHIDQIKKQRFSHIFFLPGQGSLKEDCLIFFDRIISIKREYFESKPIKELRLFSLSDYGFYLFLFKLSIHFCRIREGIERGKGRI